MSFGSLLRSRRREAGLALDDVAIRSGLTIAKLSRIERDREQPPGDETIGILAATVGASDVELLAAAGMPAPEAADKVGSPYALYRRSGRGWSR